MIYFNLSFIFLLVLVLFFFSVYSVFYLVVFFEAVSLLSSVLFLFVLKKSVFLFYLFMAFLVVEAGLNFCFLILFSRKSGGDSFFSN